MFTKLLFEMGLEKLFFHVELPKELGHLEELVFDDIYPFIKVNVQDRSDLGKSFQVAQKFDTTFKDVKLSFELFAVICVDNQIFSCTVLRHGDDWDQNGWFIFSDSSHESTDFNVSRVHVFEFYRY